MAVFSIACYKTQYNIHILSIHVHILSIRANFWFLSDAEQYWTTLFQYMKLAFHSILSALYHLLAIPQHISGKVNRFANASLSQFDWSILLVTDLTLKFELNINHPTCRFLARWASRHPVDMLPYKLFIWEGSIVHFETPD